MDRGSRDNASCRNFSWRSSPCSSNHWHNNQLAPSSAQPTWVTVMRAPPVFSVTTSPEQNCSCRSNDPVYIDLRPVKSYRSESIMPECSRANGKANYRNNLLFAPSSINARGRQRLPIEFLFYKRI